MVNKRKTFVILLVLATLISSLLLQSSSVKADWAMFRHDPAHTGVGTGNQVLNPTLLWKSNISYVLKYLGNSNISRIETTWSSPTIVDGLVYIGSGTDVRLTVGYFSPWGDVYAFNATSGAEVWDYRDINVDGFGTVCSSCC